MKARRVRRRVGNIRLGLLNTGGKWLSVLILSAVACLGVRAQFRPAPKIERTFNITGQVSLSSGRPAPRALVKLITTSGVPLQTITSDQGRFEFRGLKSGNYSLAASTMSYPALASDTVTIDAGFSGTDNVNVTLTLFEATANGKAPNSRPAVISLAEADQKVPKEALKAFRQGLKLKGNQETDRALESFGRAIALYPEYFQALSERGDLYISQHKLTEADADFGRALEINKNYAPALRGAGYCKLERKEFAHALEDFERAASVEPAANTYLLLGITNLELDRREPARQFLSKALSLDPTGAIRAHIYLANLYARERQYRQAADQLKIYLDAGSLSDDLPLLKRREAEWRARSH